MCYNSIFRHLFKFIPRYRFGKSVKTCPDGAASAGVPELVRSFRDVYINEAALREKSCGIWPPLPCPVGFDGFCHGI